MRPLQFVCLLYMRYVATILVFVFVFFFGNLFCGTKSVSKSFIFGHEGMRQLYQA